MVDWRYDGISPTKQYKTIEEAEAKRKEVDSWKPYNKNTRQRAKKPRPLAVVAERQHHSKGNKFKQFLKALKLENESHYYQQLLMDSTKHGGLEMFARWKQEQKENWKVHKKIFVIKKTIFVEKLNKYINIEVELVKTKTGEIKEIPVPSRKELNKKNQVSQVRRVRSGKGKFGVFAEKVK